MATFTAEGEEWVGEKDIDEYLALLLKNKEGVLHLHTYGFKQDELAYKSIKRQIRHLTTNNKYPTGIVCVYGEGNHWIACYGRLNYENHIAHIWLADSLSKEETELMKSAKHYIETVLRAIGFRFFQVEIDRNAPHQHDGFNCGVYSLMYIRNKLGFVPPVRFPNFNGNEDKQKNSLQKIRTHILTELAENRVISYGKNIQGRPAGVHTSTYMFRWNH